MEFINVENAKTQMRRGILEMCVLSIISRQEMYPSDIIARLKDANMLVVEGTLYPLLTRLKTAGFLNYRWVESKAGPPRKYYHITPAGENVKNELVKTWYEVVAAVDTISRHPDNNEKNRLNINPIQLMDNQKEVFK